MTATRPAVRRLGRRPGDSRARHQILEAARLLFAEVGYDRATIRAVAQAAGVDPALVHHYFGTKADLLSEALEFPVDPALLMAGVADRPETAGREIVLRVLRVWDDNPPVRRHMIGMLRTALSQEQAAEALRDLLSRSVLPTLEEVVADDTASLRAALIGTQIAGLMLGRYVLRLPAVAEAAPEDLVAAVGPAVQHYVTGPF